MQNPDSAYLRPFLAPKWWLNYLGNAPESRDLEDLCDMFVSLARKDMDTAKSIIRSYVKQVKHEVESNQISPNTVSNRLKPIKTLFANQKN